MVAAVAESKLIILPEAVQEPEAKPPAEMQPEQEPKAKPPAEMQLEQEPKAKPPAEMQLQHHEPEAKPPAPMQESLMEMCTVEGTVINFLEKGEKNFQTQVQQEMMRAAVEGKKR